MNLLITIVIAAQKLTDPTFLKKFVIYNQIVYMQHLYDINDVRMFRDIYLDQDKFPRHIAIHIREFFEASVLKENFKKDWIDAANTQISHVHFMIDHVRDIIVKVQAEQYRQN
jgi:hypothetical protein